MRLGALEAGGTKMVLSIGDEQGNLIDRISIPTATPEETMPPMLEYFNEAGIDALGIGCFGPLDLNPDSESFGSITTTPKIAWRNYPIHRVMQEALGLPVGIDTDVGAAALAEFHLGAGKGLSSLLYVTVGTGIGAGVVAEGQLVHGLLHPEWGHILLRPHADDPLKQGVCPSHEGCLEGLASGPSIERRWGMSARELPDCHPAWEMEAYYLAQLCAIAVLTISPMKIVLGGGVMNKTLLFPLIRRKTQQLLNGYIQHPSILDNIDSYIVPPGLGAGSGVTGALLLAVEALKRKESFL